jgi:indole-3-glycerol phosphate synthase/phosphoribosylanthranilate isomerase
VDWARLLGAEAVLLMLSVLDDESYGALRARARTLGMDVLTEVHTEQELSRALSLDADIIGVNNRDLTTLKVDTNQVLRLAPHVPKDRLVVAESGYHTRAQLREAAPYVHAFLVGSALMAQDHLENAVRDLMVGRVKVCGLTRKQDAQMARDLGATYGGLIAVPDSPRFVDPEQAKSLQIPGLDWVVVARNASFEQLSPYWAHGAVTAIQFHDDQTQDELIHWRRRLPKDIAIWKALPVDVQSTTLPNDVLQWLNPESPADVLVLDSQSGDHFGGTGQTFNWQLLQGLPSGKQVMLAGGLTPLNIGEAPVHPRLGYDVSSGVEQAAGVKSPIAMRRFFDRLKGR